MIDASNPKSAYTLAEWTVKPGAEDAFVEEWTGFGEWLLEHRGAESFALIKARAGVRRFVSVAVWSGRGSTVPWPTFLERLGRCRALCEQSQSRTYRPVVLLSRPSGAAAVDLAA
jgi:hypothetical protein